MVCLGFEPWAAGWKAQTNPLSYGGTPIRLIFLPKDFKSNRTEEGKSCRSVRKKEIE